MTEIKIGDRVVVVDNGESYTTYVGGFILGGFKNTERNLFPKNNAEGTVFNVFPHPSRSNEILICIDMEDGKQCLMSRLGVEKIKDPADFDAKELESLHEQAAKMVETVIDVIRRHTTKYPLILFELPDVNKEDLDDYPAGFYPFSKNYYEAAVQKVYGDDVTLCFTGKYFGQFSYINLVDLSYQNLTEILKILSERQNGN